MRHTYWIPALAALSVVTTGCGLFNQEDETPTVVISPSPQTQTFPSPTVTPKVSTAPRVALIQPTNPNARLQSIQTGRNDPFAALVTPVAQPGAAPANTGSTASLPGDDTSTNITIIDEILRRRTGRVTTPRTGTPTTTTTTPGSGTVARGPGSPGTPGSSNLPGNDLNGSGTTPGGTPGAPGEPALPPLPQPELAKAVQVTGVVVVNGQPRAIVQAPQERVSRTVTVGDRLSNGQVLVKAIDASNRAEPVVILEQVGIDVAVGIGRPGIEIAAATPAIGPIRALYSSSLPR